MRPTTRKSSTITSTTSAASSGSAAPTEAANLTYLGLHALQHRGPGERRHRQLATARAVRLHRALGLVQRRLQREPICDACPATARSATCATRPPAARTSRTRSRSPSTTRTARSPSPTTATSPTPTSCATGSRRGLDLPDDLATPRCIVHLIARSQERTHADRVADALRQVEGAYSLLFLTGEQMIAVRDPYGLPPALARPPQGRRYVFASEPPAFDLIAGRVRARHRARRDGRRSTRTA